MKVTLWRAGPPGVDSVTGLSSWTTARDLAADYSTARFYGFGGPCLYRADIADARVLDLRRDAHVALDAVGFDLDDFDAEPLHDLCRVWADVFCRRGYDWVAFVEGPDLARDEWLHLGNKPVPVTEEPA